MWYSCYIVYTALLKHRLSNLGREQSWFHLLAQKIEMSIIIMGIRSRALSLY